MFKTASELLSEREQRILIFGGAKRGKTHLSLSVINMLKNKGYKPDDILICFIDADDGVAPLIKRGVLQKEYMKSMMYSFVSTFDEVIDATNEAIKLCNEHKKTHPPETAWIIVDNIQKVWEAVRDKYAQEFFGKSLFELMKQKKEEARMNGKTMLPTFDRRNDYAIINPMHASWLSSITTSRINFILTAPESTYDDNSGNGIIISPRGQKDVIYSVDTTIYVTIEKDIHVADVYGRYTKIGSSIKNPSMEKILSLIEKSIK